MNTPDATDPRWFRQVLGQYPTGVTVITAITPEGAPTGMAVGSFTSVSLSPPLVAFFPDVSSTTWPRMAPSGSFCVNVLGAHQEDVCRLFATKGIDRFAQLPWRPASSGSPVLDGAVAWIDCDTEQILEMGDHYIVVGRVRELDIAGTGLPLLFYGGGYGRFTPSSMAAAGGDVAQSLRRVDQSRAALEELSAALGVEAVASVVVDGHLVVAAVAGQPQSGIAVPVGQRVPLAPPFGAPFVAWAAPEDVRAWKARSLPPLDEAEEAQCDRLLATVRERGYSIAAGGSAHAELTSTNEALEFDPLDEALLARRQALGKLLLHEYEPAELTDEGMVGTRSVNVPAFDRDGRVSLMVSAYGLAEPVTVAEVRRCAAHLTVVGQELTALVGGVWPGGT